jgi:hypothetical protein
VFKEETRNSLRNLIESLKRYNRYDLRNENNKSILKDVYVDPLPDNGVLKSALNDNTCFFTGRRGTGKSTVFLMAQEMIRESTNKLAIYVDVKSVYGQTELSKIELKKYSDALGDEAIDSLKSYLIHKSFISQFLSETIKEISDYLKLGIRERWFTDRTQRVNEAVKGLNDWYKQVLSSDSYRDIPLFMESKIAEKGLTKQQDEKSNSVEISGDGSFSLNKFASKLGFGVKSKGTKSRLEESSHELQKEFKDILTLYFDIKSLLGSIANLLKNAGFERTYIFLDDFSEVEEEAAKMIVDVLVAPLNNWSNDFYKLKIAAYPERIYYGEIDKQKIDEIPLDFYDMYASKKLTDLEHKAIDFTRRILEQRTQVYLDGDFSQFVEASLWPIFYEELFKATMNNPRRMGYILLYCYNSQIVHGHKITTTALREATIKHYNTKDEAIFRDNIKIQQAFGERLMVQSQKELLQAIINKSKELSKDLPENGSQLFKRLEKIYTSHFFVLRDFEFLLGTLEHNFLISKYHELKDRDGREITIYSLNYGLCQKEGILFGRPEKTEEGKYFTERAFNYLPTIQSFLRKFIIVKCSNCNETHPTEQLPALKLYDMMCPKCRTGKCELSLGYQSLVEEIERLYGDIQLPEIEFEILKVINDGNGGFWYSSLIAAEIDRSYQFVTTHAERLIKLELLDKSKKMIDNQERTVYFLTKKAKIRYFDED